MYVNLRNVWIVGICVGTEPLGLDEDGLRWSPAALVRHAGRVNRGCEPLAVVPLLEQLPCQVGRVNEN